MTLYKHATPEGPRWTLDDRLLPDDFTLSSFLAMRRDECVRFLHTISDVHDRVWRVVAPIDENQEVWASGVTYLRSRVEREAESTSSDIYARVYEAARPELFFKTVGWRAVGDGEKIRVRGDSAWNVPEPELTLVINRWMEVVGYTAGNDVSSRSIEGENPLYLPQAKSYDGSCALGPGIVIATLEVLANSPIYLSIKRAGREVFQGEASTGQMKRKLGELVEYLGRELTFPGGVFLMTGTGIVPTSEFTLQAGDQVAVTVGELTLTNEVEAGRQDIG